nr:auxin-responsive protein SAUR76 [Ipomoea batatas]
MDCIVMPVAILKRRCSGRFGYRPLSEDGFCSSPVTVVVGKERREFLVDPFGWEESPLRMMIEMLKKADGEKVQGSNHNKLIFVDVDAILFEHMLWLMQNDCSSLFQLNLKEIIDFYADQES